MSTDIQTACSTVLKSSLAGPTSDCSSTTVEGRDLSEERVIHPVLPPEGSFIMLPPQNQPQSLNIPQSITFGNSSFQLPYSTGSTNQENLFLFTSGSNFISSNSQSPAEKKDEKAENSSLSTQPRMKPQTVEEAKNEKLISEFDSRMDGISTVSAVSGFQDIGRSSPGVSSNNFSQPPQHVLRYQPSGDAMLSAINYTENDVLQEGGFDVPVSSAFNSLEGLLSAGSGTGIQLPDLLDGDVSQEAYIETSSDLQLSPQTFSNNAEGFNASESNALGNITDGGIELSLSDDCTKPELSNGLGMDKPKIKIRPTKASSPSRPGTQPCPTCGKVFSNSSALTKHKLTHSDERKYICQLCAKAFKRQDHLNGHMLTHRNKKPFECDVEGCGKSYCDARSLRRHKENHHSNNSSSVISVSAGTNQMAVIPSIQRLNITGLQSAFPSNIANNGTTSVPKESSCTSNRIHYTSAPSMPPQTTTSQCFSQEPSTMTHLLNSVLPTAASQLQFLAFQQQPEHPNSSPQSQEMNLPSTEKQDVMTSWQPQTINTHSLMLSQNFGDSNVHTVIAQSGMGSKETQQSEVEAVSQDAIPEQEHQLANQSNIEKISRSSPVSETFMEPSVGRDSISYHATSDSVTSSSSSRLSSVTGSDLVEFGGASESGIFCKSPISHPMIQSSVHPGSTLLDENLNADSANQGDVEPMQQPVPATTPLLQQLLTPPQTVTSSSRVHCEASTQQGLTVMPQTFLLSQIQQPNRQLLVPEKKRVTKELMSTLADPAVVVIADWLKVRGTLKSWTKLWCVLKPGLLLLYKSAKTHKSSQWVATVLLNACEVIERPSKKDGFCFKIFHPLERSIWASRGPNGESIGALVQPLPMAYLIFRASSESAGKCWMDALELALRCTSLLMRTMSGGKQTFQLAASDDGDLIPSSKHWSEHDLEKHFPFHDEEDDLHADSSVITDMTQNGEHSMHSSETDSDAEHFDEEEEEEEPVETPYAQNGVEEFGIAGDAGQTEEVAEENKSLIWTLVKQVRPGMDLSRVVLPTFILEPRSFLDKLSDYHYHANLLSKAVLEDDPFTRMKEIVRWYLSGFYKKPKGLKKPYNPILGETFRCYWKHPDTGSRTFYIAEQVSHHPPISAFFVTNRQDGFCISGTILAKSKFYGNSLSAILEGTGHLTLLPRGENYNITMPYAHCKGILLGTLTMELGGKVDISCEKTGYRTELEFKLKPFLGGPELCNLVSGKIKLGKETLATIEGHWDGDIFFKDKRSDEETLLWSPTPDVRAKRLKRFTVPIDSQSEFESERLWQHVSAAIQRGDQLAATDEKTLLEDAQRKSTKERLSKMEKWSSRYFSHDLIMCEWVYKHLDSRPWDPRNDVLQYEKDYIIKTKTHHKTPVVRTNSIVSMEEKRHNEVMRHMSRASMVQQGSQHRSSLTSHGSESSSPDAIHRGSDSTESDGLLRHQRTHSGSLDILALQQALQPLNQMQEEGHKTLQTIQHHLEGIMAQQNRIHQQLAQRSDLTLIASVILVQLVLHVLTFWWWT